MCKVLECTTAVVLRPFKSRVVVVFKQHTVSWSHFWFKCAYFDICYTPIGPGDGELVAPES